MYEVVITLYGNIFTNEPIRRFVYRKVLTVIANTENDVARIVYKMFKNTNYALRSIKPIKPVKITNRTQENIDLLFNNQEIS